MMKLLMLFLLSFIMVFNLNKIYLQIIYQLLMFFSFLYLLVVYPLLGMNMFMKMYYYLGLDMYSWGLIMLSLWVIMLMIMYSNNLLLNYFMIYYLCVMNLMLMMLMLCFFSMNFIMFYLWFESSLIPVFLLVMGWGGQVERIQASLYMMLYTLFGSMPLFMLIMNLYSMELTLMMSMMIIKNGSFFIYMSMILAFLMKMPMYMFHLWLPKAHVEAPVMGSMILAGVMLKLGSYGLLRSLIMMMDLCIKFNIIFIIYSLSGGLICSLICLYQIDLKMLVAYSSVVHMSLLLAGLMTMFNWGYLGGYFMMISHGLCSSGLFCLVNVSYERSMSRSIYINKGLMNYFPSLNLMSFLLCSSNLSFPPSLNLFSEIMLINSMILWSKMLMLLIMMICFLSASYTLYFYSFMQHGEIQGLNMNMMGVKSMEFFLLILHWLPLNLIFLMMFMFN